MNTTDFHRFTHRRVLRLLALLLSATATVSHAVPINQSYAYDALNRLTVAGTGSYAYDPAGNIQQITGPAAPYDTWATGFGLSGTTALATADTDGDGVKNLLEYAFGTQPNATSSVFRPTVARGTATSMDYTFTRLSTRTDLIYEVQYSTDLQTWSTGATSSAGTTTTSQGGAVQAVTETGSGTLSVKVRLAPTLGGRTIFVRLKVTTL